MTYHSRPADLLDIAGRHLDRRLAADHLRAVREHGDADKGEAVVVPCEGRGVIVGAGGLDGAGRVTGDTFNGIVLDSDVDVGDFIVVCGDKIDACD